MKDKSFDTVLRVGFPDYWGSIVPPLQHSVYGAAILENQFEPLVKRGPGGSIEPLSALRWESNSDFTRITFFLDPNRKFSNGTPLHAADFKASWEHGLTLSPKSANSSLKDILYKFEGYEDFEKKGRISGIKILDDLTLELTFKKPFRMALDQLSGKRFSAYKINNGHFIGTGKYVILENPDRSLDLTENKFSPIKSGPTKIKIIIINESAAEKALRDGSIEVYAMAESARLPSCLDASSNILCVSGGESSHRVLHINGSPGHFFNNHYLRLGIQALINKLLPTIELPENFKIHKTLIDSQIYLPFQAGRLQEYEAKQLLVNGERYIEELKHTSKNHPIYMVTGEETDWLRNALEHEGIVFSDKSKKVSASELWQMLYKTSEPDLAMASVSVVNGDPDGIYHALGKNGAIYSPMTYREKVGQLLEEGREIIDRSKLDEHYKKVSRAVLEEVPFVHIGFAYSRVAYRKDKIRINSQFIGRNDFRLYVYERL